MNLTWPRTSIAFNVICAATGGSLLTGQNIHTIGTWIISKFATGYPGNNSQWTTAPRQSPGS